MIATPLAALRDAHPEAEVDALRTDAFRADIEHRVAERTAGLEATVAQLETFSHAVAHELRAPLRAIDGFADALLDDHAAALPSEARRYAEVIRANARQMATLVDDLLRLARLDHRPTETRPVDAAAVAQRALIDVAPEYPTTTAVVDIAPLPPCVADPGLLRLLFANLLGNALKFSRDRAEPRIVVGARPAGGEVVYFVRDNGVGFDPRHADRLFDPFEQLHPHAAYEGTGLGLAIARRIVERHGGRIWAEGAVGRGATISFTLGRGAADGPSWTGRRRAGAGGDAPMRSNSRVRRDTSTSSVPLKRVGAPTGLDRGR